MRMYDIIDKKKRGNELTKEEINFVIHGYVAEEIPDYQIAALLIFSGDDKGRVAISDKFYGGFRRFGGFI